MIIHKCDICGKEIGVWLSVNIEPNAAFVFNRSGQSTCTYSGEYEICEKCFTDLYETIKGETT